MARWSLAPKRSILVHFSWIYHQKSTFLLILAPFLSEAVEDSRCYFFEDWFMKLKIYNLLKPLGTITQQNYWSFYPSELIYFAFFTMRHPVTYKSIFLFHQNFTATVPKFRTFNVIYVKHTRVCAAEAYCYDRGCFLFFHQNFTVMGPKFRTYFKKKKNSKKFCKNIFFWNFFFTPGV